MKACKDYKSCLCQDWPGGAVLKLPPAIEEKPAFAFQPYNRSNSYPQLLSKIKNCFETDFHLLTEVSLELLPGVLWITVTSWFSS